MSDMASVSADDAPLGAPYSMTRRAVRWVATLCTDEDGATAIEYGLIAALIAVAIIGSMTAIASSLSTTFSTVEVEIET